MKHISIILFLFTFSVQCCFCQEKPDSEDRILFHGVVMDANTFSPVSNSQILINRTFSSVSNTDGTFAFYANRNDSVLFEHLGYKSVLLIASDTLAGHNFIAGVYMKSDTLAISEVIIVPRLTNIKSEILNTPSKVPSTMDNARYNVAISAYQGRTTQGKLGDPSSNYNLLHQKQKTDASEKGGVPSDNMVGLNPFILIPAAYLLIHGAPEKPEPFQKKLTTQELNQIQQKYLETLKQKK
jgi:hypothetical protein